MKLELHRNLFLRSLIFLFPCHQLGQNLDNVIEIWLPLIYFTSFLKDDKRWKRHICLNQKKKIPKSEFKRITLRSNYVENEEYLKALSKDNICIEYEH
jgi:hypothetical protein